MDAPIMDVINNSNPAGQEVGTDKAGGHIKAFHSGPACATASSTGHALESTACLWEFILREHPCVKIIAKDVCPKLFITKTGFKLNIRNKQLIS